MQKRHLQQKSAVLLRGRGELLQMSFYLRVMGRAMDSSIRLGGYKKALCTAFVQQSLKEVL